MLLFSCVFDSWFRREKIPLISVSFFYLRGRSIRLPKLEKQNFDSQLDKTSFHPTFLRLNLNVTLILHHFFILCCFQRSPLRGECLIFLLSLPSLSNVYSYSFVHWKGNSAVVKLVQLWEKILCYTKGEKPKKHGQVGTFWPKNMG